jgi:hypothetical protein
MGSARNGNDGSPEAEIAAKTAASAAAAAASALGQLLGDDCMANHKQRNKQ